MLRLNYYKNITPMLLITILESFLVVYIFMCLSK